MQLPLPESSMAENKLQLEQFLSGLLDSFKNATALACGDSGSTIFESSACAASIAKIGMSGVATEIPIALVKLRRFIVFCSLPVDCIVCEIS